MRFVICLPSLETSKVIGCPCAVVPDQRPGFAGSTMTVKLAVALLRASSRAEQLTVVLPTGKTLPEAGEQTTVTLRSTRSVALIDPYATAAPSAPVGVAVTSAADPNTGRVVSATVTLNLERETPARFRAVIVTIVVPSRKRVPLRFE
jgi:hypothetical protein